MLRACQPDGEDGRDVVVLRAANQSTELGSKRFAGRYNCILQRHRSKQNSDAVECTPCENKCHRSAETLSIDDILETPHEGPNDLWYEWYKDPAYEKRCEEQLRSEVDACEYCK